MAFNVHEEAKKFNALIGAEADMQEVEITTDGTTTTVLRAMPQRPSGSRDQIGGSEVVVNEQVFFIWVADLPTQPRLDDLLVEVATGRRFRVQNVQLTCARGRWDISVTAEVPTANPDV